MYSRCIIRISMGFAVFLTFCLFSLNVSAAEAQRNALQFDIALVPGADRYLDLLEYPAYLVVALENNGIATSNNGVVALVDEHTIRFFGATLQYVGKSDSVYAYKSTLQWDIPLKHLEFDVPVEIDVSGVEKGAVGVNVLLPMASLFPKALVERIRLKVQALSGEVLQKQMLAYFDDLASKTEPALGVRGMFSKILLAKIQSQSCAASVELVGETSVPKEPGDAEPLADQAYLLATLAIWLIIGPASIAVFLFWRSRKSQKQDV